MAGVSSRRQPQPYAAVGRVHRGRWKYELGERALILRGAGLDADAIAPQVAGRFISAFLRATEPGARTQPCALAGLKNRKPRAAPVVGAPHAA